MNIRIASTGYGVNNITFGGKAKVAKKTMSSIDIAYAKELKEIQMRKQDKDAVHILNPETPIQTLRDKIQIKLDSLLSRKK